MESEHKTTRTAPPLIVSAGVVRRGGRIMLCQRPADKHNGLKWEFPGGKLEPGETPEDALKRELREELGIEVRVGRVLDAVLHAYSDRRVLVLFYPCEIASGEPAPLDCARIDWADPRDLPRYDFAGADAAFVRRQAITTPPVELGARGTTSSGPSGHPPLKGKALPPSVFDEKCKHFSPNPPSMDLPTPSR